MTLSTYFNIIDNRSYGCYLKWKQTGDVIWLEKHLVLEDILDELGLINELS